jgi:hypothetical protein
VGATTSALTPDEAFFAVGEPSNAMMGKRYESVFPVPVGDIAARSRD